MKSYIFFIILCSYDLVFMLGIGYNTLYYRVHVKSRRHFDCCVLAFILTVIIIYLYYVFQAMY